jgi:Tfp pilus assembly protein PilO
MKGSDKAVVVGVVMAVILAVFYLKVLGPKRDDASSLKKDISALHGQIVQQQQVAAFAEDARQHFPTYYSRLVVMGKAAPTDADTPSLLVELNSIAKRTGVSFGGLQLDSGGDTSSTASSSSSSTPPSGTSSTGTSTTSTTSTTATSTPATTSATPAAATEANAASQPLGATVGAAGLPTMPYTLTFEGSYFDIADFLNGVDDLVHVRGGAEVTANGRLLTIDGFTMTPPQSSSSTSGQSSSSTSGHVSASDPKLQVTISVTSYLTPADQGLTAGATPGGPAPTSSVPQTQPTSATVSP